MTEDLPGSPRRWVSSPNLVNLAPQPRVSSYVTVPASPQDVRFDLAHTAVIVVDMQNDFCHPDGWLGQLGVDVTAARQIIEPLEALLISLRSADVPVIWLNWGNRPDLLNLPPNVIHVYDPDSSGGGIGDRVSELSESVLVEGSGGAAIVDGLTVQAGDIHIPKFRMSGFWDTILDSALRSLGITHVLFTGVNLDQCVLSTLIDASCAGYDCLLVEDGCATSSPTFCTDATLYNVRQCFGFVVRSGDVIEALPA